MRSFQLIFVIIFIGFYVLTVLGAYRNLSRIFQNKIFKIGFWTYSAILVFFFIFLYIYPNQPNEARNYLIYFYFNAFLFIDFVFKFILSLFFLISLFFKNKRIISFASFIIGIGLGLGMIYGLVYGKNELKTNYVELSFQELPESFNNLKIVQISDLHLGSFSKSNKLLYRVNQKIEAIDPDLILFTGDLVNNFFYETEGWSDVFNKINSEGKSYSILGNHDYGDYATWKSESRKEYNFDEIVHSNSVLGFKLLRNAHQVIHRGSDSIFIVGVENWGLPPFPQYANLAKAEKGIPKNTFKILMTHDPAHWEKVVKEKGNYPLTLSGHTHGMQWGIKMAGIPFSLAYLTRKDWGGLYQNGNTFLYVNTGLGTVGIPWRIDMAPEITVITLKSTKIN